MVGQDLSEKGNLNYQRMMRQPLDDVEKSIPTRGPARAKAELGMSLSDRRKESSGTRNRDRRRKGRKDGGGMQPAIAMGT